MASKRQLSILVLVVCSMLVCIGAVRGQGGPVHVTATSSDLLDVDIVFVGAHPDDDSVATATLARYVLDHGMNLARRWGCSAKPKNGGRWARSASIWCFT
jgi:hypothetical protein